MKPKILLLAAIAVFSIIRAEAQGLKIGYVDANYILSLMPEARQADSDLTAHENMIQAQLQAKYKDYEVKLADYQENAASYDDLIRKDKETELTALQQSIQTFQGEAQNSVNKKKSELLQPLYLKIGKAIEEVAEGNNYDFIFSSGTQGIDILLYAKKEKNATNLVLAKLGIDPPADN